MLVLLVYTVQQNQREVLQRQLSLIKTQIEITENLTRIVMFSLGKISKHSTRQSKRTGEQVSEEHRYEECKELIRSKAVEENNHLNNEDKGIILTRKRGLTKKNDKDEIISKIRLFG